MREGTVVSVNSDGITWKSSNNLIIDKPNMQLIGTWNKISNVQYLNPAIEDTELFGAWLQKNAYLFN